MGKKLAFQFGSEKMIKISQVGRKDSLFYEGYRQALAGVAEIVRASRLYTTEAAVRKDAFFSQECSEELLRNSRLSGDQTYYNYPNNMIVFTGSRGSGKSSAMLTFVDSLQDPTSPMFQKEFLDDMASCELASTELRDFTTLFSTCTFVPLPPIDPTLLEEDGNILRVILSHMFRRALETWEIKSACSIGSSGTRLVQNRNKLMQQFDTCYEHINAIKGSKQQRVEYENLEMLAKLGDSSKLKQELVQLVAELLSFCVEDPGRDTYLVLQIDDTDMNITRAYEILEDIRKYLVIPRLIIVMATNLEHLTQVVESNFLKDHYNNFSNLEETVHNIAHQYITKLFPQTRQINLPQLDTYLREHIENTSIHFSAAHELLPDDNEQFTDSQEQIFRLIYRKTGIVFLKHKNDLHYIIPDNMRLLSHFLSVLTQMQDVVSPDDPQPGFFHSPALEGSGAGHLKQHTDRLQARLANVQRFRDYFLSTWSGNTLSGNDAHILHTLANIDLSGKVAYVCTLLRNNKIGANDIVSEGCDYVDMIHLLKQAEDDVAAKMDKKFLFAVRTYFSLLGHCIALEDLITCYDEQKDKAPTACIFPRLQVLFGSNLFTYTKKYTNKKVVSNTEGVGYKDQEHDQTIIINWKKETSKLKTTSVKSPFIRGQLGLLCAMLVNYEPPEDEKYVGVDLCSAITNSLYISSMSPVTPFLSKNFSQDIIPMLPSENKWLEMRSSSLLVVLNWEVQQVIGRWVAQRTNASKTAPVGEDWKTQYIMLKNFYSELARPFNSAALYDGDTDTQHSAIYCLEKLDLSGWLARINSELMDPNSPEIDSLKTVTSAIFLQNKKPSGTQGGTPNNNSNNKKK